MHVSVVVVDPEGSSTLTVNDPLVKYPPAGNETLKDAYTVSEGEKSAVGEPYSLYVERLDSINCDGVILTEELHLPKFSVVLGQYAVAVMFHAPDGSDLSTLYDPE